MPAGRATVVLAVGLGDLLGHDRERARRALALHGAVPGGVLAVGVLCTRIEDLAAAAAPLHHLAVTAGLRALDAGGYRLRRLALGVLGACHELAVPPGANDHGCITGGARLVGLLDLGPVERLGGFFTSDICTLQHCYRRYYVSQIPAVHWSVQNLNN